MGPYLMMDDDDDYDAHCPKKREKMK